MATSRLTGFLLFCSLVVLVHSGCIVTSQCATFQTLLIQTNNVSGQFITTVKIRVTNTCPNAPAYYIGFAMKDTQGHTLVPVSATGGAFPTTFDAHYSWTVAMAGGGTPNSWLQFTPAGGVQQGYIPYGLSTSMYPWEDFWFYVTGYVPQYEWYWRAHFGSPYDVVGPLDMSLCLCEGCDSGYNARVIGTCTLGYPDTTTTISNTVFNENIVLLTFALQGTRLMAFYSDEHPICLGVSQVTYPNGTIQRLPFPATPPPTQPKCIYGSPFLNLSNNFNAFSPTSSLDGNGFLPDSNGCDNSQAAAGYYCPRPMSPTLFITDTTTNPSSRAGDWQQGGVRNAYLPTALCGSYWKGANKVLAGTGNTLTTYTGGIIQFAITPEPDPTGTGSLYSGNKIGNNSANVYNLGAGADFIPIWNQAGVRTTTGFDKWVVEVIWDLSALNLNPSHNFRLQFMVHDGDQTRVGGDVGQACVSLSAQCPPGWANVTCDVCDKDPAPHNGQYTWFCLLVGALTDPQPYQIIKIPKTAIPNYQNLGFIPNETKVVDGYSITCDCQRAFRPCSNNCCGLGKCNVTTGVCACYQNAGPFGDCCLTGSTPTPVAANVPAPAPPPPPPCFNNGIYCSGNGNCVNGSCNCTGSGYIGPNCSELVPLPPPPTCEQFTSTDCEGCLRAGAPYSLTCLWCPRNTLNSSDALTNGTCVSVNITTCAGTGESSLSQCFIPPPPPPPPPCPDNCTNFADIHNGQCQSIANGNATCSNQQSLNENLPAATASNYTQFCCCAAGVYGINCAYAPEPTPVVNALAAGLGAGAVVGIIIGVVLCAALAGGGGVAYYQNQNNEAAAPVKNNPLYKESAYGGTNPLNTAC